MPQMHDRIIRKWDETSSRYGYIDIEGNEIINTSRYKYIYDFSEGFAKVENAKNEVALINTKGEIVIPFGKYNSIGDVHCGVAEVNGTAYVLPSGLETIPVGQYERIVWRNKEDCVVQAIKGNKFGYVDKRNGYGITPMDFDYSKIDKFSMHSSEGMTIIKTDSDLYVYNEENHKVYKSKKYSDIGFFSEGLCAVIENGKLGFIDKEGENVIPCLFDEPSGAFGRKFEGGLCALQNKLINKDGKVIKDISGYYASCLGNERYVLTYMGRVHCILIDKYGKTLFKGTDGSLIDKSKEFPVAVRLNKWGFMDENGKIVVPCQFNEAYAFHNGFATIEEPIRTSSRSGYTTSHSDSVTSRPSSSKSSSGCYIATAVYGSYDCPEVWTLRRYRDSVLDNTWYGRFFIRTYYAISPTLVKWFGKTNWFRNLFREPLNRWVNKLNEQGVENIPYTDKY